MPHLIKTIKRLEQKKISFKSITENIDTTSPGGRLIFYMFGALAEFERDLIKERVQAGLKAARARARGKKGGRPSISNETKQMIKALMADKTLSIKQICDRLFVGKSTLYKYANMREKMNIENNNIDEVKK